MKTDFPRFLAQTAALALLLAAPAAAEKKVYRFGVVPQQKLQVLVAAWPPLLAEVGRRAGVRLQFETAPSIAEFHARCRRGEYDFIYLNPSVYAETADAGLYAAVAREDIRLQGILVVSRENSTRGLTDLRGLRVAFPSPGAYAATSLNAAALASSGLEPDRDYTVTYHASQDAAYDAVLRGLADAAGGVPRTFDLLAPSTRSRLRVLHRTPRGPPHAFAVHVRVPAKAAAMIGRSLAELSDSQDGRRLLEAVGMKRIVMAGDKDWDELRR